MGPDPSQSVPMACSQCGQMANVPAEGDAVVYLGTPVTARGSGLGSFCAACNIAFCSAHAIWAKPQFAADLVGHADASEVFIACCPNCGATTGGRNLA